MMEPRDDSEQSPHVPDLNKLSTLFKDILQARAVLKKYLEGLTEITKQVPDQKTREITQNLLDELMGQYILEKNQEDIENHLIKISEMEMDVSKHSEYLSEMIRIVNILKQEHHQIHCFLRDSTEKLRQLNDEFYKPFTAIYDQLKQFLGPHLIFFKLFYQEIKPDFSEEDYDASASEEDYDASAAVDQLLKKIGSAHTDENLVAAATNPAPAAPELNPEPTAPASAASDFHASAGGLHPGNNEGLKKDKKDKIQNMVQQLIANITKESKPNNPSPVPVPRFRFTQGDHNSPKVQYLNKIALYLKKKESLEEAELLKLLMLIKSITEIQRNVPSFFKAAPASASEFDDLTRHFNLLGGQENNPNPLPAYRLQADAIAKLKSENIADIEQILLSIEIPLEFQAKSAN